MWKRVGFLGLLIVGALAAAETGSRPSGRGEQLPENSANGDSASSDIPARESVQQRICQFLLTQNTADFQQFVADGDWQGLLHHFPEFLLKPKESVTAPVAFRRFRHELLLGSVLTFFPRGLQQRVLSDFLSHPPRGLREDLRVRAEQMLELSAHTHFDLDQPREIWQLNQDIGVTVTRGLTPWSVFGDEEDFILYQEFLGMWVIPFLPMSESEFFERLNNFAYIKLDLDQRSKRRVWAEAEYFN